MSQITLSIEGSPLPPSFVGTPQEFFEAILERMRVVFPTSQTSFVISDTEPNSNLGPWLKEGTKWYVWSNDEQRYIPLDISDSLRPFVAASAAPSTGDPPIWLQVSADGERAVGWYLWLNDAWQPVGIARGATADRPADPIEHERYFDTDIGVELFYYNGLWRTVAGVPGDEKFVVWPTLDEALEHNPGWEEVGQFYEDDDVRGRAITAAHKDPGPAPSTSFVPSAGVTARYAGERYGEEMHVLTEEEISPHTHTAWDFALKLTVVPDGTINLTAIPGDRFIESDDLVTGEAGGDDPHNNIQPSMALWRLVKL